MPAYVIVEVAVYNQKEMEEYRTQVPATLRAFDGKFLVRGGQTTLLEGGWDPERIVLLEFPSVERAKAWWHSAIYAGPKLLRQKAGKTKMILVEGV